MVVASGLFTENIYKQFIRRGASERHYLWVGRVAALVIVLLALLLQTTFEDVIHALKVIIQTPAAIGISLWFGISWRRWNTPAVWVSSLATFATWAFAANYVALAAAWPFLDFLPTAMLKPDGGVKSAWVIFLYLSVGVLAGIVVSLLTPRPDKNKLDYFFRLMRTPVKEGEIVTEPCTIPEGAADPVPKLFDHPDIEIPRPTTVDLIGFALAWSMVFAIIGFVMWLAS
jgi:Na+/proline symporter